MRTAKRFWIAGISVCLLGLSAVGEAALSSATDSHVAFDAAGPGGFKIEGTTTELTVAEVGGNVVITVPLRNVTTGIGLRDQHMRDKYLEIAKYPTTVLTVARSALKLPGAGERVEAEAPATIGLHGQTRPVTIHYTATGSGASVQAKGRFHINMNDFGINVPSYLGVTVKPDVEVNASFRASGD